MGIAPRIARRDGLTLLLAIALTTILCWDGYVGRLQGGALLIAYLIYFVSLVRAEHGHTEPKIRREPRRLSAMLSLLIGLVTVILAAHVVVTEGVELAESWGISQTVVGVLLIALGTSLPELAVSVGAMRQGHANLSVGNVIGSNIFDLLVPVGLAAVIHPLVVEGATIAFDLPALMLATAALLVFMSRKRGLQRREAVALIGLYVAYAALRLLVV
jgi:cation:H+ antiporter